MKHLLLLLFILILHFPFTSLGQSSERPETIVIPVSSLGKVSEVRKQILQNTLEDELKSHFRLISQERFEEAQEKAFDELDYEECTEDQCIILIQEMLQVENVFHLQVLADGRNTQLSVSWRNLDENRKEEEFCEGCGTGELRKMISGLVVNILSGKQDEVSKKDTSKLVKNDEVKTQDTNLVRELNVDAKVYEKHFFEEGANKDVIFHKYFTRGRRWKWIMNGNEETDAKYVGRINNNLPNGKGIYTNSSGDKIYGYWRDGKKHGLINWYGHLGSKIEGTYKNDQPWNVSFYDIGGNLTQKFKNGVFVKVK